MNAQRDPHRLTAGEWRGERGAVTASVGMAAAVCKRPEAPAVTVGASALPGTSPVGLPLRFSADRRRGKVGVRLQRQT